MAQNPQVKGGVVPYLTVGGGAKAAEFYTKAFGAEIATVTPPDDKGRTMHAHVYINGGSVMMSDAYPEHGHPLKEPAGFNVTLPVSDVDFWYARAIAAGSVTTRRYIMRCRCRNMERASTPQPICDNYAGRSAARSLIARALTWCSWSGRCG